MKSKQKFNPFLGSFAVFSFFVLITVAIAMGLFYYIFSIPEPEGLSLASWPQWFTNNFSVWIEYKGGNVEVKKTGLSQKLSGITDGIRNVSLRSFNVLKEKGMFSDIYAALNKMDAEIRQSDRMKEETERARKEWIANITHDLKTPLSPIKGYAELLADKETGESVDVQEYGEIILKNVCYVEKLLNDLKLTYQLDSGAVAFYPQKVLITRYLKELVIDIINDPVFSDRNIEFDSDQQKLTACLDPDLFRRAVQNIIINALVHNPSDKKIKITLDVSKTNDILISISDNEVGMNETEQAELFKRYYRGTNTKQKPEGSGLGLAIAKQIVVLHGGDISVKSSPGIGTEFIITLAKQA